MDIKKKNWTGQINRTAAGAIDTYLSLLPGTF